MLGDEAIQLICGMLPPDGAKSGKRSYYPSKCNKHNTNHHFSAMYSSKENNKVPVAGLNKLVCLQFYKVVTFLPTLQCFICCFGLFYCSAGLRELTLSANPAITTKGWARLAIAVAHSSQLRVLNLDYNPLGNHS